MTTAGAEFEQFSPDDVGAFYDSCNVVLADCQGGVMHYGYWTGPDDPSDYTTAAGRLTDLMIDRLGPVDGDHVLDLGCGTGGPAVRLARSADIQVTGVSISRADVEQAAAKAARAGLARRLTFRLADALALPFDDETFDAVFALESVVHIPDRARVLAEIARVLRPGGRVILTDFTELRKPESVETLEATVAAMAAWRAAPPALERDYPAMVAAAGLALDDILDITENTRRTASATQQLLERRLEREGSLPETLQLIHDLNVELDVYAELDEEPSHGVIVARLHKP